MKGIQSVFGEMCLVESIFESELFFVERDPIAVDHGDTDEEQGGKVFDALQKVDAVLDVLEDVRKDNDVEGLTRG